jgi:hypothetical protein
MKTRPRPKRSRRPKLDIHQIRQFFYDHNCYLLTNVYLNSKQLLQYRCKKCRHINVGCYNNLYRVGRDSKQKFFCRRCYQTSVANSQRLQRIALRQKLYNITETAQYLGVSHNDLYHHIRYTKRLPPPTHTATVTGIMKFYNEEDLKALKKLITLEPL